MDEQITFKTTFLNSLSMAGVVVPCKLYINSIVTSQQIHISAEKNKLLSVNWQIHEEKKNIDLSLFFL